LAVMAEAAVMVVVLLQVLTARPVLMRLQEICQQ